MGLGGERGVSMDVVINIDRESLRVETGCVGGVPCAEEVFKEQVHFKVTNMRYRTVFGISCFFFFC